jgi:16S rRNA (guanine966-N2)-methyltransferase
MKKTAEKMHQHKIRIIGGQWRSRILTFPDTAELRPTPNRIRETLFNWLSKEIVQARCLDLFAGSGALGFEALSRGADHVTFVDCHSATLTQLEQNIALFKTTQANVINLKIPSTYFPNTEPFNLVFLDPPFKQNLIGPCCEWLETQHLLAKNAYIYIEAEKNLYPLPVPSHWQVVKSKTAGEVGYHLCYVQD